MYLKISQDLLKTKALSTSIQYLYIYLTLEKLKKKSNSLKNQSTVTKLKLFNNKLNL